jgi:hypothetical protein
VNCHVMLGLMVEISSLNDRSLLFTVTLKTNIKYGTRLELTILENFWGNITLFYDLYCMLVMIVEVVNQIKDLKFSIFSEVYL